jgi:hypothetical protein
MENGGIFKEMPRDILFATKLNRLNAMNGSCKLNRNCIYFKLYCQSALNQSNCLEDGRKGPENRAFFLSL